MKNLPLFAIFVVLGSALVAGCISPHTWPDYERGAENKMVVIQEKIGGGLESGALTPDQSQSFLTELKVIRTDYKGLKGKMVSREAWDSLHARLDVLEEQLNRALARTSGMEEQRIGDRILTLQRSLDDGRINGRLLPVEEREFQARMDSIRSDYLRMTEDGRSTTYEESADISRRLDSLELDLNRYR